MREEGCCRKTGCWAYPKASVMRQRMAAKWRFLSLYFSLMRWILLRVSNELKTAFCSKRIGCAPLLLISSRARTPAVLRIVPFHNQGVKGQDIITHTFLLASWKSHLRSRGNREGNVTVFVFPLWHQTVKNSPFALICRVPRWLLFRVWNRT